MNGGNLLAVETSGDRHEASSTAFELILGKLPQLRPRRTGRRLVPARGPARREPAVALLPLLRRSRSSEEGCATRTDGRGPAATQTARRPALPNTEQPWRPRPVALKQEIVGTADKTLMVLSGAALAMLLLACVNVAGLLLGKAATRVRELGTRAAIGATPGQIARQLLIESVVSPASAAQQASQSRTAQPEPSRDSARPTCRAWR